LLKTVTVDETADANWNVEQTRRFIGNAAGIEVTPYRAKALIPREGRMNANE
jgi:hypothetical protein